MSVTAEKAHRCAEVVVTESQALPEVAFRILEANVLWPDGSSTQGWGKSGDWDLARLRAIGEAVERYAFAHAPPSAWFGPRRELANNWQELDLVGRRIDGLCGPELDFAVWVPAVNAMTEEVLWVPAHCVLARQALAERFPQNGICATSSGCASGASIEAATLCAALELVERDAFLRHWQRQRPGRPVAEHGLPEWAQARLASLRRLGCRSGLSVLDMGHHPTLLAWAQHDGQTFTTLGAACALDASHALEAALNELELQAVARALGVPVEPVTAELVQTPADHACYYAMPDHYRDVNPILEIGHRMSIAWDEVCAQLQASEAAFFEKLRGLGHPIFRVDLSVNHLLDPQLGQDVFTVRALAPRMLPLTFGQTQWVLEGAREPAGPGAYLLHPFA